MCAFVSFTAGFPGNLICGNKYAVIQKLYLKSWEKAPECKNMFTSVSVQHSTMEGFVLLEDAISLIQNSTKMKLFECCWDLYLESSSLTSKLHDKSHYQ